MPLNCAMQLFAANIRNSLRSISKYSGEAFYLLLGQVAGFLGYIVQVRVITSQLDPNSYGSFVLAVTISAIVNQVLLGGLANGFSRFYSVSSSKNDLLSFYGACRILLLWAISICLVLAASLFAIFCFFGSFDGGLLVFISVVIATVTGYNSILGSILNAARRRFPFAISSGFDPWIKILFILISVQWMGSSSIAIAAAYLLASLVAAVYLTNVLNLFSSSNYACCQTISERNLRRSILNFSLPFSFWGVFGWFQLGAERWSINHFASTAAVGQFAILAQIGNAPIGQISTLASSFFLPIVFQHYGSGSDSSGVLKSKKIILQVFSLILFISFALFLIVSCWHVYLFKFLAPSYASVSWLLAWTFLAAGIQASGQILAINMMSSFMPNTLLAIKVTSSLLGILFAALGAFGFGLSGVVFASLLSSIVYAVLVLVPLLLERKKLSASAKSPLENLA